MRLPFPFGRRSPAPAAPDPDPASAPPPVEPARPVQRRSGEWSNLPPIQRTVASAPLIAPARPFTDGTAGHRGLPPILRPLAHELSTLAPQGLVVARTVDGPGIPPRALPEPAPHSGPPRATAAEVASDPLAGVDTNAGFGSPGAGQSQIQSPAVETARSLEEV